MYKVSTAAGLAAALLLSLMAFAPAAAQEPAAVEIGDNFFAPIDIGIAPGETVRWTWTGSSPHNVTSTDESFDGSETQRDGTFDATFPEPGIYRYLCTIHSNMTGQVTVGDQGSEPPPSMGEGLQSVSGDDPVETALAYSATLPDGGTTDALIGTSRGFADSLASGSLQGLLNAPLLLTATDELDDRVVAELDRLGVQTVTILGGVAAISQAVQDELESLVTTVRRVGGNNRIETALAIADLATSGGPAGTVIVARAFGENSAAFADALAAGAASATTGFPVLLTPTGELDEGVAAWMAEHAVEVAYVAGGPVAVSQATENAITDRGIEVRRLEGQTRVSTAIAIFLELSDTTQPTTVVEGEDDLAWASGFAAALSSSGGILLTRGDEVASADTLLTLFGVEEVRCGPTLTAVVCGQLQASAAVDGEVPAQLMSVLDPDQETPPNESGASGSLALYAAGETGLCVQGRSFGLTGPIQAAHVHEAPFGTSGPPVVPFALDASELGGAVGCVGDADSGAVSRLFADPEGFYTNIHTEANPDGEIRGQVFAPQGLLSAPLTGAAEVPGPGDADAFGVGLVWKTGVSDELCYVVTIDNLDPVPTMAHIHRGESGVAGDIVVPLEIGAAASGAPGFAHCDRGLDPALVSEIFSDPAAFYVNVHNEPYPAGAIRGQLAIQSRD